MRSLAAKLLLRLDSSAKSGDVFTQHVLSGRASTLLVFASGAFAGSSPSVTQ